jgi:serine/threonine protein kinase
MATSTNHPQRIGKYEILSVLGRGGMGVVYQARDTVIDRIVAVKTISPEAVGVGENQVERLLMEARSAGRLHHPNIVTVFDFGREDDLSYIVMEYAEGVDLGHVIGLKQSLGLAARVDIILQVCQGLAYAHDRGVTHRDMKPANVRLTFGGTAKILDFGLARFDDTHLTKTGFISGTVAYMSPERLQGQTGKSDDIFALGAVAYELLTYQQAFQGSSAPEIIFKIVSESPRPVSTVAELPSELDAVITRAMAREVSERFPSVQEFSDALAEVASSPGVALFISSAGRSADFIEATSNTPAGWRRDTFSRSGERHRYVTGAITQQGRGPGQNDPTQSIRAAAPAGDGGAVTQVVSLETSADGSQSPNTEMAMLATDTAATQVEMPLTQQSMGAAGSKSLRKPLAIGLSVAAAVAAVTFMAYQNHRTMPGAPASVLPAAKPSGNSVVVMSSDQRVARANRDLMQLTRKVDSRLTEARKGGVLLADSRVEDLNRRVDALGALADKGDDEAVRSEGAKILADYDEVIRQSPRAAPALHIPAQIPVRSREKPMIAAAEPNTETIRAHAVAAPVHQAAVTPAPAPAPAPAAASPPVEQPSAGNAKGEITTFIHNLGNAYQTHDASFFARYYLPYDDKFGEAIRRNASTAVDIQIDSIEIEDPNHARVVVKRTDTLDRSVPPATQHLAYQLEKQNGQWKIVKFARL